MTKVCTGCHIEKSVDDFYKAKRGIYGRASKCKACTLEQMSSDYYKNPQPAKDRARKHKLGKFGMTEDDYDKLFLAQGGRCWICEKKPSADRRLAVDHNHRTGEVRGLLCSPCNRQLLGTFHENARVFTRAASYLDDPPSRRVFNRPRKAINAPPQTAAEAHSIMEEQQ